jgi:hypothetical protein
MLRDGAVPWWPGVCLAPAPIEPAVGAEFVLVVRSPIGYRLRVNLRITQVEPERLIAADAAGDLRGRGSIIAHAADEGSILTFFWDVETRRAWMNLTAPVLGPVFVRAHERVMARGERGLRTALTR